MEIVLLQLTNMANHAVVKMVAVGISVGPIQLLQKTACKKFLTVNGFMRKNLAIIELIYLLVTRMNENSFQDREHMCKRSLKSVKVKKEDK